VSTFVNVQPKLRFVRHRSPLRFPCAERDPWSLMEMQQQPENESILAVLSRSA
jgi:hypothetical protein